MLKNKMTLDLESLQLSKGGKSVGLRTGTIQDTVCRVALAETTVIPPKHEIIVEGKARIKNRGIFSSSINGVFEPKKRHNEVLIARELVNSDDGRMPVRMVNLSDENVTIYKNTIIGTLEPNEPPLLCSFGGSRSQPPACVASVNTSRASEILSKINLDETVVEGNEKEKLIQLITEYQDVFSLGSNDIGRADKVKHRIDTGSSYPIRQAPRRVPVAMKDEVKNHIEDMLNNGIIRESCSPWASPIVLVKKKDGGTRFCIDYRKLNNVTKRDAYPLPRMDDALETLSGAKYFSTLDLISGYWQVEVAEEDRDKTAFATHVGLYEFNVMPFGLCGAPSTFQRLMEAVLGGMQWESCMIYLDDIIVFGRSFQEHNRRLQEVFKKLRTAGLKMKPQKCQFLRKELRYLCHIVSPDGIRTDPEKTKAVKEWPTPSSAEEVRQFLGLASYYRRFIRNFANLAARLHKISANNNSFKWTEECTLSFNSLKHALTSAPVLAYPNVEGTFILDTDASDQAIGGVLSQIQDGQE